MKKHEELRVGNYIFNGAEDEDYDETLGHWHQVRSIGNEDQEFEQIETETDQSFEWVFRDNWRGIPLSKEWVLALGGKILGERGSGHTFFLEHGGKTFLISNTSGFWKFGLSGVTLLENDPAFRSVHHLQNLCQSFTGLKLVIK